MSQDAAQSLPVLTDFAPLARLTAAAPERASAVTGEHVTLLGSRRDCHLPVVHGDVSKVHAAICNTGRELLVCDLRSRTGTFVNDQRVTVARLRPGDQLRLGPVVVDVRFERQLDDGAPGCELGPPLHLRAAGRVHTLAQQPAVIGRRNTCDVQLDTPDVSLAHALIFVCEGHLLVADLGSRSGTKLNGQAVTLAAFGNGDTLNIGGESLVVDWAGKPPQPAAPPAVVVPHAVSAQAAAGPRAAAPGNLEETILSLQQQVLEFQSGLGRRAAELEQRAAELDRRSAELELRSADVDALTARITADGAALALARGEVEQQRGELHQEAHRNQLRSDHLLKTARAVRRRRQTLVAQEGDLRALRAELAREQGELREQRAELQQQREAAQLLSAELALRQQTLDAQAAALASAEQALATREAQLAARETESAEASRKIEHIRQALENASKVFSSIGVSPDAAPADAAKRPRAAGGRAAAARNGAAGAAPREGPARPPTERPPSQSAASAEGDGATALPAPMVTEPIFAIDGLEDLPPDARERVKVLRRVSDKSDAELVEQVRAEVARRPAKPAEKPRKSRWWS